MDLDTSRIPFGGLIDKIRNDANNDDDFDPSYIGLSSADREDDTRIGLELVLVLLIFLFALVAVRYGCIFFIDAVILCRYRRNRVRNSNSRDDNATETHANDRDRDNNTTTDYNNDTDDNSSSGSVDLEVANCDSGTKILLLGLTLAEKRNVFSSVLECRKATESDIRGCLKQGNINNNKKDNNTNNSTSSSTVDPVSDDIENNNDDVDVDVDVNVNVNVAVTEVVPCCAICIQDIKVGDQVGHSKLCRHLFHLDCIVDWLSTGSTLCPCCRRVILTKVELEERLQRHRHSSQQSSK